MPNLRFSQRLSKAKKLTKEELRKNPFLAALIRGRIKELKAVQDAKKATEFDFD